MRYFFLTILFAINIPVFAATITVDSTADNTTDDGECTLREAIQNSNSNAMTNADCVAGDAVGDTIEFSSSLSIVLAGSLPNLTDGNLTIDAGSNAVTLIKGAGNRLLRINSSGNTITSTDGVGSIVFDGNRANVSGDIIQFRSSSSNNTISNCQINNGSADGIDVTPSVGSSIMMVNIDNCSFDDNFRAALFNGGAGRNVTNSSFTNNTVTNSRNNGFQVGGDENDNLTITGNTIDGSTTNGIILNDSDNNTISGNTVSNSGNDGIEINGTSQINAITGNTVSNNQGRGIFLDDGVAGQVTTVSGNTISSNSNDGIQVTNNYTNTVITGNNISGNGADGLDIRNNSINNQVTLNSITGNSQNGIRISTNAIGGNTITSNTISTNSNNGIRIDNSSNNSITDNTISSNSFDGVEIRGNVATGNLISQNSISGNTAIGIDLHNNGGGSNGVTPNDAGDSDGGGNQRQNFPEISNADVVGTDIELTFTVPSTIANSAYPLTIEVFIADSDGEEGQTFIGSVSYVAGEAGIEVTKSFTPSSPVALGAQIVATATDNNNNTSEFAVPVNTTPVTLNHFSSKVSSGMVELDWGTSSELFNVGFQLWGLDGADGGWKKLHNWLVKSGNGNAVEPQSYRKRVKVPNSIDQLISVGISSVDSDGREHYYGPFELGQAYGDLDQMEPIAWDKVRSELDTRMAAAGYVKDRVNGYRKASVDTSVQALSASSASSLETVVEFSVSSDGLYRITSAELAAADIDWSGALKRDIAVLDAAGEPVVRYVKSGRKFGTGGEIYVYGHSPDERAGLYTDQQVYRLVLDRNRALNAPKQGKSGVSSGFSPSYTEASMVENDRQYIFHSAADDPWVSAVVMSEAGKPRLHGLSVPMEADADLSQSLVLHLGLGKSSDLPGVGDEHVVRGAVLSEGGLLYLGSQTSNDTGLWDVEIEIPGNTPLTLNDDGYPIVGGEYSPGSGYGFSQVHVDRIGLSYARPYVPKHGDHHLEFSAPDEGELGYEVVLPDDGYPWVFASDGDNLVRIVPESARRSTDGAGNRVRTVRFGSLLGSTGSDVGLQYWVGARQQALSVNGLGQREIATQASLLAQVQGSNYVMIAHPMFMGDALNRYADHKRGEGYRVSLINYLDVVDAYGGGQAGPVGLTAYLSALEAQGVGIEYVLMVGGSTYDHTGNGSSGAITFIPAHYGESDYSKFTVSDAPYVMDGDGHAFASIGRWPVRSVSDVETIVDKSIVWSSKDHSSGEALLIAEHTVDGEGIDFGLALDGVAASLPVSYNQTQVYVDRIMAENPQFTLTQALSRAKSQIIAGLNQGPDVVLYNGHASTRQLSNQNLLKSGDVSQVTSAGAEVWIPLSCYVTFFENTDVNSLSYQLMFSGNAVGITGAMLLSNQGENLQMGASILESTMHQGQTIGDAVNNAKAALNDPNVNINWNYLGDPTTSF